MELLERACSPFLVIVYPRALQANHIVVFEKASDTESSLYQMIIQFSKIDTTILVWQVNTCAPCLNKEEHLERDSHNLEIMTQAKDYCGQHPHNKMSYVYFSYPQEDPQLMNLFFMEPPWFRDYFLTQGSLKSTQVVPYQARLHHSSSSSNPLLSTQCCQYPTNLY